MEQIIVKRGITADNVIFPLNSPEEKRAIIHADQTMSIMNEDAVNITVESSKPITFLINDRVNIFGRPYKLNQFPTARKTSNNTFTYDLKFDGIKYSLINALWFTPSTHIDALVGTLEDFVKLIIENINRVEDEYFGFRWSYADCPKTGVKLLTYQESNCLNVLTQICQEFNVDWDIIFEYDETVSENPIICFGIKNGTIGDSRTFGTTLQYGRGKGLYEINRKTINSSNIITKLYCYGSDQNLPTNYPSNRLCLNGRDPDAKKFSYIIGQDSEETPSDIDLYGLREGVIVFDDIYPTQGGTVTALIEQELASYLDGEGFIDENFNINLNEQDSEGKYIYLIPGVKPIIHFNTGQFAGFEFELKEFVPEMDNLRNIFVLKPFKDENGIQYPDIRNRIHPDIGSEYVITNINLPQQWVDEAEERLLEAGTKAYLQTNKPQIEYEISLDQLFIKKYATDNNLVNVFKLTDFVRVIDNDFGIDSLFRVDSIRRDILNKWQYEIGLGYAIEQETTQTNGQRAGENTSMPATMFRGNNKVKNAIANVNNILNTLKVNKIFNSDIPKNKGITYGSSNGGGSDVTYPITLDKGGTGATNASGARDNLGLGDAALKDFIDVVASGSDDLITSGAVYEAMKDIPPRSTLKLIANKLSADSYGSQNELMNMTITQQWTRVMGAVIFSGSSKWSPALCFANIQLGDTGTNESASSNIYLRIVMIDNYPTGTIRNVIADGKYIVKSGDCFNVNLSGWILMSIYNIPSGQMPQIEVQVRSDSATSIKVLGNLYNTPSTGKSCTRMFVHALENPFQSG